MQICGQKDKHTKKSQQIGVGVVQGYSLQGNNQQQRKQLVRYQNKENKSEITGINSATKNVTKKRNSKRYKILQQTQQFGNAIH
jgi:hypothetical protein